MRTLFVRIGLLILALSASASLVTQPVMAAGSTSYMLYSNFDNETAEGGGNATNYVLTDAQQTWEARPATSTNYELAVVTDNDQSSSSSAGGTTGGTSGGASGGETGGGGGGTRSSYSSSSSVSSSEQSSGNTSSSSSSVSSGYSSSAASRPFDDIFEDDTAYEVIGQNVIGFHTLNFFDAVDDGPCVEKVVIAHAAAGDGAFSWIPLLISLALFAIFLLYNTVRRKTHTTIVVRELRKKKTGTRVLSLLISVGVLMTSLHLNSLHVYAAQSVPLMNMYNGRLLDSSGNPVTTEVSVRFSYWTDTDYDSGDVDGSGNINTGAASYIGWSEVQAVTPDSSGRFSLQLGSITSLPDFSTLPIGTLLSLYLQVEVKPSASANTAYELLDTDPNDAAVDRSGVLSVPFAQNADFIDQREIGTGSGNIAILGPGGRLPDNVAPDGTNSGAYVIDADNTETTAVTLQFGTTLAETLKFDIVNSRFVFSDDLRVEGNLTVTGLINGVDITNITGAGDALKASSGGGLNLNVQGGSYRINGTVTDYAGGSIALTSAAVNYVYFGSGGLSKNTSGFPTDESIIRVAEVTTTVGSINDIDDRRVTSSDDREKTVTTVMNPAFEKASYQGDGANNVGQLSVSFDNTNKRNFYLWTSTKSTLQDYDTFVRIPLSPEFTRWLQDSASNPITVTYRSTSASATDNKLDITVYDTNGVPVTLSGSTTDLANTSWTTSEVEFTGSPTWTAGGDMVIKLTTFAKDSNQMQIGGLKLQYTELQ